MRMSPDRYNGVAARSELLVTGEEMEAAIDRMAQAISQVLADKDPLVLCVMTGGIIPVGRLLPRLGFQLRLDYVHATRYRGATRGAGLEWLHHPAQAVRGEHVLVVDDILDEGFTLEAIVQACRKGGAAGVHSAVLVEKERPRTCPHKADFVGVKVPERYLYGYGLDYMDYFRNAPGIYAVADADL
ncbi:MAG: hypoxanthine-guanine phosphoribosyltransferase [Chromatiaceae bacterium]